MAERTTSRLDRVRDRVRNLVYTGTDTNTGESKSWTVVTDGGPGMYADGWGGEEQAYRGGMALVGCWRAARLQASVLATAPWDAYRMRDGYPEKITPTPMILDRPAPPEVRVDTLSAWHLDLMWHGNAIGIYTARDRRGTPTAVVPVPADMVQVERVGRQEPGWPVGAVRYWAGGRWWSSDQVMHVKGLHRPGDLRGMGILEIHAGGALKLAANLQRQAGDVAEHAVPSVILQSADPEMTPEDAAELKSTYLASQRSRSPMVLNPNTTITPLAWNPDESQLIEARQLSLVEQALLFGLDPTWLGAAQSSRVYANAETEAINVVKFSVLEHFTRFEQVLSAALPRGQWVEANLDALLRADTLTRYQAHEIGIRAGFLTDDEARQMEGRRPLTSAQRARIAAGRATTSPTPANAPGTTPNSADSGGAGVGDPTSGGAA
jgi:HK97 family phage portal protein